MILITRYHDFSCGHRVMQGEGACARLHGHNYRVTFKVAAPIDATGHAIEFSVIKRRLCLWLENKWDHRFLLWEGDPMLKLLRFAYGQFQKLEEDEGDRPEHLAAEELAESICAVPFHPTTENIAQYLLNVIGPQQLKGTGAVLEVVEVSETRKCGAIAMRPRAQDISGLETPGVYFIDDPRQGELG